MPKGRNHSRFADESEEDRAARASAACLAWVERNGKRRWPEFKRGLIAHFGADFVQKVTARMNSK